MAKPILIKKYGNRRLYDTDESCYLTLEELAEKIQKGADVRVVEVKTGEDLTQATLTQIVIESRGAAKFLPVPLLTQMIRLGDDALAEFLGQYMSLTMELYLRSVRGMQMMSPFNTSGIAHPIRDAFSRFFPMPFQGGWGGQRASSPAYIDPEETPPPSGRAASSDELAALRKEMEELKAAMASPPEPAAAPAKKRKPRSKTKR
jgi:polyhydroxyalkanoate synthesis repressor PhaR